MRKIIISILLAFSVLAVTAQQLSIDNHIERARSLYERQKYREALFEFGLAAEKATDRNTLSEIGFYQAVSKARLGCDTISIRRYLEAFPETKLRREALFTLAGEYFEAGDYGAAHATYRLVDSLRVPQRDRDEYSFRRGYSAYLTGNNDDARTNLTKVDPFDADYYPHALYALANLDYNEGRYAEAERGFELLTANTAYAPAMPYMILLMRFLQSDWEYVTRNGDDVLAGIEGGRRRELQRMIAESWFRQGGWAKAQDYLMLYARSGALDREENYMVGYAMYRLGKFDGAVGYLRAASGPDDNLTQRAAYILADCYLRKDDHRSAMQSFSMAYRSGDDPEIREDALYNYCKTEVGYGDGHFDEEIQSLRQYLTQYPSSAHRKEIEQYFIGACYTAHDRRNAYEALYEFRSLDQDICRAIQDIAYRYATDCFAAGDLASAEVYLNRSLEYRTFDRSVEALALLRLGDVAYARADYPTARKHYEAYVAMNCTTQSEYPFALYMLGYTKFSMEAYESAFDDFADFTEIYTPKDSFRADALNRMGDIEAAARAYDRAINCYAEAARMTECTEHFYAAYRVAMMEGMAGRNDRRIAALRSIIKEGKGDYYVRSNYELGGALLTGGIYDEATRVLENFVRTWPSSPYYIAALSDLGLAYRNTGDDDNALRNYRLVVERAKGSVAAQNALSEIMNIYVGRGEVDTYFDYAVKVGAKSSVDNSQRDSLTFVAAQKIYMSGDKARAEAAFDSYLVDNPDGVNTAAALYYGSDCSASVGNSAAALEKLARLTGMYYNNFTRRAYERMAQIGYASENYAAAADAYRNLGRMADTPQRRAEALELYLKSVEAGGNPETIIAAADDILGSEDTPDRLKRRADFAKAKALRSQGKQNPAVAIFSRLAEDVTTPEGAESAYIVIETAYRYGSRKKAEELVFAFSEKNTPYNYWLAKSFLTLGDIYLEEGDSFQARATYQSIVDGYSVSGDGIIDEAKERIANL
ncbi:MAG: tetratricopeptide repeat protein [Tidjanibacter sp.]|nr:tetratricopeptide repeat protein [Tidjanibacter sp.]